MKFRTEKDWQQAAFNAAFRGLRSQEFVRSRSDNKCMYRQGGIREARVCCAVGWLIPDSQWDAELNSDPLSPIAAQMIMGELQPITESRRRFLHSLQQVHDGSETPVSMEARLRQFASDHGFTIPDEARP